MDCEYLKFGGSDYDFSSNFTLDESKFSISSYSCESDMVVVDFGDCEMLLL